MALTKRFINFTLIVIISITGCHNTKVKEQEAMPVTKAEPAPVLEVGKIVNKVTPNGSYALYIPKKYSGQEKFPVIIFLDPHADGSFPLTKYEHLAEKFGILLIGSNDSKNGISFDQSKDISARLLNEAVSVLPASEKMITLAGFSGGAKAALVAGSSVQGFQGVIYCGAAFPPKNFTINTPLFGFAGKRDMNYTEVKNFNYSLNGYATPHSLVEWDGKHEWPDSAAFLHAFYWISLNGMKTEPASLNKKLIEEFKPLIKQALVKSDVLNKVLLLKEAINTLSPLASIEEYQKELSSIEKSSAYAEAKKNLETNIFYEDKLKEQFANSFEDKDLVWWKKQINLLQSEKKNITNQRILGYISLAAWTYSTKAVEANNVSFAEKALEIYKQADPENSEQPFLMARLCAKNNMPDSAIYFLKEAVKLGLKDKDKINNESDLTIIRGRSEFAALLEK